MRPLPLHDISVDESVKPVKQESVKRPLLANVGCAVGPEGVGDSVGDSVVGAGLCLCPGWWRWG